jgi:hypothetical protein
VFIERKISEDWRKSFTVSIGKRDIHEYGNYRGIKLMSHSMNILENIKKKRIRSETPVSDNQFSFMLGKSTI